MAAEVGVILEGKVTGVKKFGAFVSFPDGSSGLVHISEISNRFVEDITKEIAEGQTVRVKVIGVSPEGKIALSIKQAQPAEAAAPRKKPGAQRRNSAPQEPNVWRPRPAQPQENMSFEDMMNRYKTQSEEKMAALNRESNGRRGTSTRGRRR